MHDVLRFWLDRGVDGFRIDVVHELAKDPELRDNGRGAPRAAGDWQPTIHERLRRIRRSSTSTRTGCSSARSTSLDLAAGRQLRQQRRRAAPRAQLRRSCTCRGAPAAFRASIDDVRGAAGRGGVAGVVPRQSRPLARRQRASTTTARGLPGRGRCCSCSTRCAARRSSTRARSSGCPTRRSRRSASSTSTAATPSARRSPGGRRRPRARRRVHDRRAVAADRRGRGAAERRDAGRRSRTRRSRSRAGSRALRRETPALQAGAQRFVDAGADVLAWVRGGTASDCSALSTSRPLRARVAVGDESLLVLSTDPGRAETAVEPVLTLGPGEALLLRLTR